MGEVVDELYNAGYFNSQLKKFKNRNDNHWAPRINKVFDDIANLGLKKGNMLDLGTSVGTYAYEFATRGWKASGIDLSEQSIEIANKLALENDLNINYVVGDVADLSNFKKEEFDLVYAGDIVEHLPDDVLREAMNNCYKWLKPGGYFVFHTVPTKYDVLFHKTFIWVLLVPFAMLPDIIFKKIVHLVYCAFNILLKFVTGKSWTDREREGVHCNLQEKEEFVSILNDAAFVNIRAELTINEDRFKTNIFKNKIFAKKDYFKKDLFGVAYKEGEFESPSCDFCLNDKKSTLYSAPDLRLKKFHPVYRVVECRECGHRYLSPRPTINTVAAYYPTEYYANREHDNPNQIKRYKRQLSYLPAKAGSVLDVGCAGGAWLKIAKAEGWDCLGTDFVKSDFAVKDIKIDYGYLPDIGFNNNSFDVVTAWGVMEHVHNPSVYFKCVHQLLKSNGQFIFMVPNGDSLWSRWAYCEDLPRHLHFFRPKLVKKYARKYGFSVKRIEFTNKIYSRPPTGRGLIKRRFLRFLGCSWQETFTKPSNKLYKFLSLFATILDYAFIHPKLEEYLHLSGNMVVVLEKD